MYVKHDGRVFPCCQSYMLDGAPVGDLREQGLAEIFNSDEMRRLRRLHAAGPRGGDRYVLALLHRRSRIRSWRRKPAGAREMGPPRPAVDRAADLRPKLPPRLLTAPRQDLVQIQKQ